jgi:hypothetical protein
MNNSENGVSNLLHIREIILKIEKNQNKIKYEISILTKRILLILFEFRMMI